MKDLTSILMGDPGTHPRRNPTPEEQERSFQWPGHGGNSGQGRKRFSEIYEWRVWETRYFPDRSTGQKQVNQLYQRGMAGSITTLPDGSTKVTRVE